MDLSQLAMTAAALIAAFLFLIFLIGILATLFTPVLGFIDLLLEPLAALYYKISGKKEEKEGMRTDYSIKQGEEVK